MRFLADAMLGKLARKMRMLGYDTAGAGGKGDAHIRYRCRAEGRIVLTRDRALAASLGDLAWEVTGDNTDEELASIADGLRAIGRSEPMTRCLEDNARIEECSSNEAAAAVPPRVLATNDRFFKCPDCGRIYWAGTHAERMEGEVAKLMQVLKRKTKN